MTDLDREIRDNTILESCERDCSHVCTGCDRTFHQIKIYEGLNCDEELPESLRTNSGNYYCHADCYSDCH